MQEIKYLTQEEAQRFFAKIKDKLYRSMFKLMYDFGLRASEVGKLTLKDFDMNRGRLWVTRAKDGVTKSQKEQIVRDITDS
ncbi:MAG: tyrosine-type recombinase/integrase [Nitrospirales bacterium]